MNSITKRWVKGSLALTICLLLASEILVAMLTVNQYYNGVRQAIMTRINTLNGQLSVTESLPEEERQAVLHNLVTDFDETDKFELMLLDSRGSAVATSSGFMPAENTAAPDYLKATKRQDGVGEYVGSIGQGERVMAITSLLTTPAGEVVALRLVTSLSGVDGQIAVILAITLLVFFVVVFFSVVSGLFFVNSIVRPVGEIEVSATRIAAGDFDVRIEGQYNDEIGRLCDTINHMAEELGRAEQMKNEFISSVSHELRTPLTSIKGWTETLARVNDPESPDYQRGIRIILDETDRLYGMVEELLDFSRMQNGGLSLSFEKLDIIAEVSDAVLMCAQRARLEGKALTYDEPEFPCPVWGDKNRLRQVFINLLDNALKYTPPGGSVTVTTRRFAKKVVLDFADTGAGIDPADLRRVKQKFYKGKGAVRGSGIGLAVANEIVAAHGGTLEMFSKIGEGTTARVTLPISEIGKGIIRIEQTSEF